MSIINYLFPSFVLWLLCAECYIVGSKDERLSHTELVDTHRKLSVGIKDMKATLENLSKIIVELYEAYAVTQGDCCCCR